MSFLQQSFLNNTVLDYLYFLISLIGGIAIIRTIGHFLLKRLNAWSEKSSNPASNMLVKSIKRQLLPIAYLAVFYLSIKFIYLANALNRIVSLVLLAGIAILGAMLVSSILVFIFDKYRQNKLSDRTNETALRFITFIIKGAVWIIAVILFLDNIGVKINSLIAGLGIGGVAIAFAAQSVLADIFCFFTIFFDKPFEIGDYIVAGQHTGTVEHIGLKTTRLRALSGEQLICSNADLTGSRISNFKTMEQRRALFRLGVTYDTALDKLKEIPELIKSIIEGTADTTFLRAHFIALGSYSLEFEIAYYVLSSSYDRFLDIQQEIILKIMQEFDARGIKFALPTQTLNINNNK